MEIHSKYSPSQLPRIVRCPGSVQLTQDLARSSSVYAQEGTMLHSVVELCLTAGEFEVSKDIVKQFKLDDENKIAIQDVLDWVLALHMRYEGYDFKEIIETKVTLAGYNNGNGVLCPELDDVWGTLDYSFYVPDLKVLVCADWKFGRNVEVFPDTEQLKAYALGRIKNPKNLLAVDKIICAIVQPRLHSGEPIKEEEYTAFALFSWLKEELVPALREAVSRNPSFHPSEKACMWCEARRSNVCKERHALATEAAQNVFAAYANLPNKISKAEIAKLMEQFPLLEQYMKDMRDFASAQIQKGLGFPGWKMVHGRSIRQWATLPDDKSIEDAVVEFLEEQDFETSACYKPPEFRSPTQVEKLVGKKISKLKGFQDFIVKPKGKPTLVPEDDRRPAIDYSTPEEVFGEYTEED